MLVAIDIGNTNAAIGFFQKGKLVIDRRISTLKPFTEDEAWVLLKNFCDQAKFSVESIQGAIIASVVPDLTDDFTRMFKKYLKLQPIIVSGALDIGIKIPYEDPARFGADRICGIVAAIKKFGGPTIVVDFGTATTYDVISSKGEYLGGVIAPGVENSAMELFRKTARLPRIELQFPDSVIGKDTMTAIQSGVMYGAVDSFEGMVRRLRRVSGKYTTVIATGGHARKIAEMSNEIKYMEPNLILEGARLIYERLSKKAKR